MKYTPENCEKLAQQLIDLMLLENIKELAVYSLSQEMQKREDIFDMNVKGV